MTEGTTNIDTVKKIGKSLIQHGKFNNRIYVMECHPDDQEQLPKLLDLLAVKNKYAKIIAKIPTTAQPSFILSGYKQEAYIPKYYKNKIDCLFVSKVFDEERTQLPEEELNIFNDILNAAPQNNSATTKQNPGYVTSKLGLDHVNEITDIFKQVFKSYPFPIFDPDYIAKTMMSSDAQYFGVREENQLIAVSTAEISFKNKAAEMTDFAVLPKYRGQGLAQKLLAFMEKEMRKFDIKTLYTIARLKEIGMNKTFIKAGYKYTGTLINNTNISGDIESMNIYYKQL